MLTATCRLWVQRTIVRIRLHVTVSPEVDVHHGARISACISVLSLVIDDAAQDIALSDVHTDH